MEISKVETGKTAQDEAMQQGRRVYGAGLMAQFLEKLGVGGSELVYAPPVEKHGVTVIPAARIAWGWGFGGGSGQRVESQNEGGGGGGGGGIQAQPVGYIEITESGTRFEAIPGGSDSRLVELTLNQPTVFGSNGRIFFLGALMGGLTVLALTQAARRK